MEWQPIETYDKKGNKEVLVYVPRIGIFTAWFCTATNLWPHGDAYNDDGEPCNVGLPTHWMPLPEPPSGE